jgi:hypothetical protein
MLGESKVRIGASSVSDTLANPGQDCLVAAKRHAAILPCAAITVEEATDAMMHQIVRDVANHTFWIRPTNHDAKVTYSRSKMPVGKLDVGIVIDAGALPYRNGRCRLHEVPELSEVFLVRVRQNQLERASGYCAIGIQEPEPIGCKLIVNGIEDVGIESIQPISFRGWTLLNTLPPQGGANGCVVVLAKGAPDSLGAFASKVTATDFCFLFVGKVPSRHFTSPCAVDGGIISHAQGFVKCWC